ncbi:MAG TPA: chaperone modulator CbpM [Burkholderiales bacterium]|nr:chaperone modulator CbpM [Burkholderiales bacterium]
MGDTKQDGLLLDERCEVSLTELRYACGLSVREIRELTEFGVFEPRRKGVEWRFAARSIELARKASRLKHDFGLNTAGVALALTYVERIAELEKRLRELECQILK